MAAANAAADRPGATQRDYVLRLFVTGHTEKSVRAVRNITRLCEKHLQGAYKLEVIDVYQQPELAAEHQLVAAPTLFKVLPLPPRKMIGDMSDTGRVLAGLGIPA
ncbi:MAG TPA: circadian clock KaiB family protein [Xanthobacteraceae bacterium]|jgi:circadian clock protein KaiB|nr:circadian clock KaiB family protein [Xanthobacteraceae bacterium]